MKFIISFFILVFIATKIIYSQLTVTTGQTPQWYVQNVLLGTGVQVSNISYTGSTNSIGRFTTGNNPTNLGLSQGLILSTGVVNGNPAIGSPVSNFASTNLNLPGSPILNSLIPGYTTYDAIILEFDFVPLADTIRFRYVFGSEEYPEWVGSSFNDVFGFFISGPNPLGGNYNNYNIARIPNTTLPVSINTINQNSYTQYYVNNQALNGQTIVFDGFTTVLTAWVRVIPCQQYNIKIAIADAGDQVYDSAVFLEANSFSSNAINIQVDYSISSSLGYAIEDCNNPVISFCLNNVLPYDFTLNINVSGTATSGVDYQAIPLQYVIPAGQLCAQTIINTLADNMLEGTETIVITTNATICGGIDSIILSIADYVPIQLSTTSPPIICPDDTTLIQINASNGFPPYSYQWDPILPATDNNFVSPSQTTTYSVTVSDLCQKSAYASIVVTVDSSGVELGPDINICNGQSTTLTATNGLSFLWSTGATNQSIIVAPNITTQYSVTATGVCFTTDTINVIVYDPPLLTITDSDSICKGEQIQLSVYGATSYIWNSTPPDPSLSNQYNASTVNLSPNTTTIYSVTGTDVNNCSSTIQTTIYVFSQPQADFHFDIDESSLFFAPTVTFFDLSSGNPSSWLWYFGDGTYSTIQNPIHTYSETVSQTYYVTLMVENEIGCFDTITKPVNIVLEHTIYIPNAFTPENNGINDFFYIHFSNIQSKDFSIRIFNKWGEMIFESYDPYFRWDGTYKGEFVQPDLYSYIIQYRDTKNFLKELRGFLVVVR